MYKDILYTHPDTVTQLCQALTMHECKCVCLGMTKFVCASWCERSVKDNIPPYLSLSLSLRVVRLDWSGPGRPSGIMLGYDVLRRTLRSCAVTSTGVTAGEGSGGVKFRCSYLQCPASHGVCGTSCFHPDTQVIMFWTIYHI